MVFLLAVPKLRIEKRPGGRRSASSGALFWAHSPLLPHDLREGGGNLVPGDAHIHPVGQLGHIEQHAPGEGEQLVHGLRPGVAPGADLQDVGGVHHVILVPHQLAVAVHFKGQKGLPEADVPIAPLHLGIPAVQDRVEIVDLSSDILTNQKIIGHLPEEENEIMISNYIADLIINRGIKIYSHDTLTTDYYKISNYEQLLDENTFFALNHTKVKISGIIDYDLSKYDILKNKKWDELTKEELEIGDDLIRKAKNIYNKIYVKKELIDNMKKTDPCITTGVMYPIQSKDQINSIFPKLLSNEKNFSIKTAFSEEYYHILYLNSILKPFFLVIGVISFIIFVIIVIGCIIKKKDRSIFLKDFLVFMVICSILSSMLYSLNLVVLKNVICRNYFQKLSPFQFYFKQYFILLILSIIVPMLMYSLLLLKNRFKKKSTDPF